jgi:hypothetical protein
MRTRRILYLPLLLALVPNTSAVPQNAAQQAAEPAAKLQSRVFQLKHASPDSLIRVLQPLTSGRPDAAIASSAEMMTISVRDLPENLATIESAIRLLDKPSEREAPIALELRISLIAASQEALENNQPVPQELAPVMEQLRRTLSYKHYRYVTTLTQRSMNQGGQVGASGPTATFFPGRFIDKPAFYDYKVRNIVVAPGADSRPTIHVNEFEFAANIPVVSNLKQVLAGRAQNPEITYQKLSMLTGLALREGEHVVVGTSGVGEGDKALIVVVSITRAAR